MTELKVLVSPHFSEESFTDELSGITFAKGAGIYTITLGEHKLSGIKKALRLNILLPTNKETLEFLNENNILELEAAEPETVEEPVEAVKPVEKPKRAASKGKAKESAEKSE